MTTDPVDRPRGRAQRRLLIVLPFDDIMEFALALLSVSPAELEALGWSFANRKRLLDHFLVSGKAAQSVRREDLPTTSIELALPPRDVERLRNFARRELAKRATNARVIDRVLTALDDGNLLPYHLN